MRLLSTLVAALATMVLAGQAQAADELKPVNFSLDWAYQGNHGIWALALNKGMFKDQGLDVTMDRGFGSGDTVSKVAAGTYDIGFADINAVIKFNAQNPDSRIIGFYQVMDRTPNSIISLAKSGIEKPADLMGHTLGAPEADSSRMMFPAFAKTNGIDPEKVKWTSMAPNLREALLVQGQVDAITGFASTSVFNLIAAGVPRDDIKVMPYAKYGLDLYGSALIARPDYIEKHPEIIRGFVKATIDGTIALIKDPQSGMAALKEIEPLFDEDMEAQRLQYLVDTGVLVSPALEEHGLGYVDPKRMEETIKLNAEVYDFSPPSPETIYTTKFLPDQSEREVPKS